MSQYFKKNIMFMKKKKTLSVIMAFVSANKIKGIFHHSSMLDCIYVHLSNQVTQEQLSPVVGKPVVCVS